MNTPRSQDRRCRRVRFDSNAIYLKHQADALRVTRRLIPHLVRDIVKNRRGLIGDEAEPDPMASPYETADTTQRHGARRRLEIPHVHRADEQREPGARLIIVQVKTAGTLLGQGDPADSPAASGYWRKGDDRMPLPSPAPSGRWAPSCHARTTPPRCRRPARARSLRPSAAVIADVSGGRPDATGSAWQGSVRTHGPQARCAALQSLPASVERVRSPPDDPVNGARRVAGIPAPSARPRRRAGRRRRLGLQGVELH